MEAAREKISQSEQRVGSPKAGKLTADGSIPDSDAELELKKAEEELKVATLKVVLTMGGPGSSAGKTVSANFSPDGLYAVTAHKDERAPKRGTSYVWDLTLA